MTSWASAIVFVVLAVIFVGVYSDMEDQFNKASAKLTKTEQDLSLVNDELEKTRQMLTNTRSELKVYRLLIKSKNEEMNEMQIHITNKANELHRMTQDVAALRTHLEEANEYAQSMQDEHDALIEEYEVELQAKNATLRDNNVILAQYDAQIRDTTQVLYRAQQQFRPVLAELERLKSNEAAFTTQATKHTDEKIRIKRDHDVEVGDLRKQIKDMNHDLTRNTADQVSIVEQHKKQLAQKDELIQATQPLLDHKDQMIQKLEHNDSRKDADINRLTKTVESHLDQKDRIISELEREVCYQKDVIGNWEKNNANTIRALQGQISDLERENIGLRKEIKAAEELHAGCSTRPEEVNDEGYKLGVYVAATAAKASMEQLKKENAQLKADTEKLNKETKATEEIYTAKDQEGFKVAHTANVQFRQDMEKKHELLKALNAELSTFNTQLKTTTETLYTDISNLRTENRNLRESKESNRKLQNSVSQHKFARNHIHKSLENIPVQLTNTKELYRQKQAQYLVLRKELEKVTGENAELEQENDVLARDLEVHMRKVVEFEIAAAKSTDWARSAAKGSVANKTGSEKSGDEDGDFGFIGNDGRDEWPEFESEEEDGDDWKEGMRSVVFGGKEMWLPQATGSETETELESKSEADTCEFPEESGDDEDEMHLDIVTKDAVEKEMAWVEDEKEWVEAENEPRW
jgi:chromosome segregation ATPase